MDLVYVDWIRSNVEGDGYGRCAEATAAMQEAFPELKRMRGHYIDPAWGEREHWWLEAPDRSIIDPTVAQFPSRGLGGYVPWDESSPEPTGKCMDCGQYTYGGSTFCSEECEAATMRYLETGIL